MAVVKKRNVKDILNDTLPDNSKNVYNKKWDEFMEYLGEKAKPEESDYLQYFDHLHNERGLKASTLWSTYSMLNSIHQREFGERLQNIFPRVTQLLKKYNSTYERKVASIFQKKDIDAYLSIEETTPYVLVRKAIVAIAISGGLRTSEVRDLNFDNLVQDGDTYNVTLVRKKQNGEKKKSKFIIPASLACHVNNYVVAISAVLGEKSGPLIKGTPIKKSSNSSRFVNQPMGKNLLYDIGKDVATKLQLEHPETYTGHCFRRTSATMAADGGATVQQMQRAFGWKSTATAQKYIEETDAGAQAMASIYSKTVRTTSTVVDQTGEQTSMKTYNIHGAGESSVFNFY